MESKNIFIICSWAFLITLWILSYLGEWDLFWPLILTIILLAISISLSFTTHVSSSENNLSEEIKQLKLKVEKTSKDIEEIKKNFEK